MARISPNTFITRVSESAAVHNFTYSLLNEITSMMEKEGWADIERVQPPSLRRSLLKRFPHCVSNETRRRVYPGTRGKDNGPCTHQTQLIFASEAALAKHKKHAQEDFDKARADQRRAREDLNKMCADFDFRAVRARQELMKQEYQEIAQKLVDARRAGLVEKAFDFDGAKMEVRNERLKTKPPKRSANKPAKKTHAKLSD